LCDETSRARFRRFGTQALYTDASCYWPQGVMAQVNPRVVSVVRNGLDDPPSLGSLGSLGGLAQEDGGLTLDETISLGDLLRHFAPQQIVFLGTGTEANFFGLNAPANAPGPKLPAGCSRLILGGERAAAEGPPVVELGRPPSTPGARAVRVRGRLDEPSTLAAIRALLQPGVSAALVLTGDVSEADSRAVLHGLAPFLGPKGVVLLATGRYDRYEVESRGQLWIAADNPLERAVKAWFESTSAALGYGIWDGERLYRAHLRNWIVLVHAPETMFWSGQWMPVVTDLGYGDGEPRADGPPERNDERANPSAASGAHLVPSAASASDDPPLPAVSAAASDR
jgi:hypothetical protein